MITLSISISFWAYELSPNSFRWKYIFVNVKELAALLGLFCYIVLTLWWDLAECGWDLVVCGWDLAECGWDLVVCGWDLAEWLERLSVNRNSPGFDKKNPPFPLWLIAWGLRPCSCWRCGFYMELVSIKAYSIRILVHEKAAVLEDADALVLVVWIHSAEKWAIIPFMGFEPALHTSKYYCSVSVPERVSGYLAFII